MSLKFWKYKVVKISKKVQNFESKVWNFEKVQNFENKISKKIQNFENKV
jgi:hypothetical protein